MTAEVWRVIPEFPLYEITDEGDVRHRWTRRRLLAQTKATGESYHYKLFRREGRPEKSTRGMMGLIYSAFPELLRIWRPIPGHPSYMFNKQGDVLSTRTWERISPHQAGSEETAPIVRLRANGGRTYWSLDRLDPKVVEALFEEKAA